MDYIKGISHKLSAFEVFLKKWPEHRGKIILVQVVLPTQLEGEEYLSLRGQVNEFVGRINGEYGTVDYLPIHYVNRALSKYEIIAILTVADACIITPLKGWLFLPIS